MAATLNFDGIEYSAADQPLKLLELLRRHLDQTLPNSLKLKPLELLRLKGWLLAHAEQMPSGKSVWIEETTDGATYRLVAAIGRTDDSEAIVWHEPLPWPFKFGNRSEKLDF